MFPDRSAFKETPSQTSGPYVHIGLAPGAAGFSIFRQELGWEIAGPETPGKRIEVEGTIRDGSGALVKDLLIEVWHADGNGIYPHPDDPGHSHAAPGFRGWGRVITDFETGLYSFATIKPGPAKGPGGALQAPHISLWLVARGINIGLQTRLYFDDEAEANAADPVLRAVVTPDRIKTLIASRSLRDGRAVYRYDICLQGDGETVFFDL